MSNSKPPLDNNKSNNTIKFLCGYGGKIVPRYPDGKLRYLGGHTRVLAVDRSISFPELLMKMGDLCGTSVVVRCQLPTEDLDALVSIKSDEDLINIIEEYDLVSSSSAKIKAFLWPTKLQITPSPTPSEINATSPPMLSPRSLSPSPTYTSSSTSPMYFPVPVAVAAFPICHAKSSNGVDKFAPPQNQLWRSRGLCMMARQFDAMNSTDLQYQQRHPQLDFCRARNVMPKGPITAGAER